MRTDGTTNGAAEAKVACESLLRPRTLNVALMATTALLVVSTLQSPAQSQTRPAVTTASARPSFNIPAQPLSQALVQFSNASGVQVFVNAGVVSGINSPGASGALTPSAALNRLLAGTGLTYRFTNAHTVAIERPGASASGGATPAGAISLDTIDVQGETAWGPVNGFVASRSATATKTDTPILEVPQSISVVTRDQIETRRNQTLNETLQYTPGVLAGYSGQQQFAPGFVIRGFDANGSSGSIYLNGLRSATTWSDIEPYGLERVEVMRGPASVLYGQGEPSGVIALVTKRPSEKPIHEFQLQGGSFEQRFGAFDFGGPVTEDRTLLYRFTGLLREGGNGIDFSNDKRAFLSGSLTWRPTAETEITAHSLHQRNQGRWNFGLPAQGTVLPNPNGRIPLTRFIGEPAFDRTETELTVAGYNLQHHATDSLTFRQNLQYSREIWERRIIAPGGLQADLRTLNRVPSHQRYTTDMFAVDNHAELRAATGPLQHTVLFGVDYRWGRNAYLINFGTINPIDVFAPVYGSLGILPNQQNYQQTQNLTGIYLQDQIKLDRWILTLGGRHDWADSETADSFSGAVTNQNDRAFTKRAGLGYEFDSGVVPYINYAESFTPTPGTMFDGTPLKPQTGVQYEAGIKYQPKDMNLRITAAVYDLRRQNVATNDPDNPGFLIQIGEVASRGFEFEAVASLTSNLNLTVAYAYNDARVTRSNDGDVGNRPVRTPPHLASLWADYTIREGALSGLGFGGGIRYISASAGDWDNTFDAPAYTVVDAMARYDIDNWRFSVNVTNLFDNQYVAGCFSITQCNVGRFRTVLGRVSYRW